MLSHTTLSSLLEECLGHDTFEVRDHHAYEEMAGVHAVRAGVAEDTDEEVWYVFWQTDEEPPCDWEMQEVPQTVWPPDVYAIDM